MCMYCTSTVRIQYVPRLAAIVFIQLIIIPSPLMLNLYGPPALPAQHAATGANVHVCMTPRMPVTDNDQHGSTSPVYTIGPSIAPLLQNPPINRSFSHSVSESQSDDPSVGRDTISDTYLSPLVGINVAFIDSDWTNSGPCSCPCAARQADRKDMAPIFVSSSAVSDGRPDTILPAGACSRTDDGWGQNFGKLLT